MTGGAIYSVSATLTLISCFFYGNVTTDGNGGAVWAEGGNLTITGGEFLNNTASRFGGAAVVTDGWLKIEGGARFEGNNASAGGALFCGATTGASAATFAVSCSFTEVEFVSNRATSKGFDTVSSFGGGGAAAFFYADATVANSMFKDNHAQTSGGALYGSSFTSVSVNGGYFGGNTAEEDGGAMFVSSMALAGSTQLTENSAIADDGAVSSPLNLNQQSYLYSHTRPANRTVTARRVGIFITRQVECRYVGRVYCFLGW